MVELKYTSCLFSMPLTLVGLDLWLAEDYVKK